MGTLYLDQNNLEVRSEGSSLTLYENDQRRGCVPMNLVDRLVIRGGQIRLDSGVLMKLAEAGATTVLLSPRISRRVAIVLGPAHNDAAVRLAQAHRVLDSSFCVGFGQKLITAKIRRQRRTLVNAMRERPDERKAMFDAVAALNAALGTLQTLRAAECTSIRGIEGAAARAYFQGFRALVPPSLGFVGRRRRPPTDPVNACLSLAYTLLHGEAVRAAHAAGIDPLLGFYHRPAFGRESLACDLIEPLRPAADAWVWEMLRSRRLREEHFTVTDNACLLGKTGRERFYQSWESVAVGFRRCLRAQATRLARHLRDEGEAWLVDEDDEA